VAPSDSDLDDQMELDIWDDEDLAENLEEMLRKADVEDRDWLPPRLQQQQNQRKGECNGLQIIRTKFKISRSTSDGIQERTRCYEQVQLHTTSLCRQMDQSNNT
jgi:hypothetical protein